MAKFVIGGKIRSRSDFATNHKFCHFWVKVAKFVIGGKI